MRRLATLFCLGVLSLAAGGCSNSGQTNTTSDAGDTGSQTDGRQQGDSGQELLFPDQTAEADSQPRFDSWDQTAPDTDSDQYDTWIPPHPLPCKVDSDCAGGPCIWHMGQRMCSVTCIEECPKGFICELYLPPPDTQYACFSLLASLCQPCLASKDCPGGGDRCLVYPEGNGTFCGGSCSDSSQCPAGFECVSIVTTEGDSTLQCVDVDGECECSDWAVENSLVTSCFVQNETGACPGTRSCTVEGFSQCDARNPQQEICFNQIDDDCNGLVDDPDLCVSCDCGDGKCQFQCGEYFDPSFQSDVYLNCAIDCAVCGNGHCDPGESFLTCPQDCCGVCGDGACRTGVCAESAATCAQDCPGGCGNGTCEPPEDAVECPQDCPRESCGNLTCEPGETPETCPGDCVPNCGDCICQPSESAGTCPTDCGYCGDGFCLKLCPHMYAAEDIATCFQDCCQPNCVNRECGSDGCGALCGACNQGFVCSDLGKCVCVPQCSGKECGPDGCGGICGNCSLGTKCDFGQCMTGCDVDGDCPAQYECLSGYCALDLVDDMGLLPPLQVVTIPGQTSPALLCHLLEPGVTDLPGSNAGLSVQFGYSTLGWDPRQHPEVWTWLTAAFDQDAEAFDTYQWSGSLASPGTYFFTFRATLDGNGFQFADSDGLGNGFDPALMGLWTVTPPPAIVSASPGSATVMGGDQILLTGTGFHPDLVLKVDGAVVVPESVTTTQVLFKAPSHAAGKAAVTVTNPDTQSATLQNAFTYVLRFTPTLDGSIGEWSDLLKIGTNSIVSGWDASKNKLSNLYAAYDSGYLYVAVEGYSESMNYILCYIDMDFGASSGVKQMVWLSDNDGNGDLDDAFSNVLEVSVPGYGADWGFGTRGMASFAQGSDLSGSTYVGWRAMGTPYNLPWFQGTVKSGSGAVEAAVPLATVLPQGIGNGTQVALFCKLTDRYGDLVGISNQTLPEFYEAGNVKKIGVAAEFQILP